MVRHIDVDRFESRTPTECATAAIEAGLSKAAVETLTTEFEAVRYGGVSVSEEREHRARHALSQLELDSDLVLESDRDERGLDSE